MTAPHPPLTDYYEEPLRREQYVRDIFDETAPWYDWATRFMSFGSGDWYRREAVKRTGLAPGMKLLDIASGTGVVAQAAAEVLGDPRAVVSMDASFGMLTSGRTTAPKVESVAERLGIRDASFDRITIGFAMRHFADLDVVFRECHRVLRPGGKLLILEITAPESRLARVFLGLYMGRLAPAVIHLRTRSARTAELFRYYWETTRDCVRPAAIQDALVAAGFKDVQRGMALGIFSEYTATKR